MTDGRPQAPSGHADVTGFDDPDFVELCAAVRALRDVSRGRVSSLGVALRALPRVGRLRRSLGRLPSRAVPVSDGEEGQAIRSFFRRRFFDVHHLAAISTLTLPAEFDEYLRGRSRQAVRTNCSRAAKAGVTATCLRDDALVRERMQDLFGRRADADGGAWYFERAALREGEFWFATAGDTATLAMAEVIVDDSVALLRSMISAPGDGRSDARYLLTVELLASLSRRGVRHVIVGRALSLPPGLAYFQKRLGFSPTNLTLLDVRRGDRRER